jgi:hypothetical protein
MQRSQIDVDTVSERRDLNNEGTGNFNDDGNYKEIDDPIYLEGTVIRDSVRDVGHSKPRAEENRGDEPSDDVQYDQRNVADMEIPTDRTVKVNCPTNNCN